MNKLIAACLAMGIGSMAFAATDEPAAPRMATPIPPQITTPDSVETRIGKLKFFDGFPDSLTVIGAYDNLDFIRGVQVFLNAMPGASLCAMREGLRSVGRTTARSDHRDPDGLENLSSHRTRKRFISPAGSTSRMARWWWKRRPTPRLPGRFLSRYIIDMGMRGRTRARAASSASCRRDTRENSRTGYYVAQSRTFGVWLAARGLLVEGDTKPAVDSFEKHFAHLSARPRGQTADGRSS